jgi:hypothetical protein
VPSPSGSGAAPALPARAEGCQIVAQLGVKRVPGAVRFVVRQSGGGLSVNAAAVNTTHTVHDLFFGPRVTAYQLGRLPPRTDRTLHRLAATRLVAASAGSSHEHFLRVVPTTFSFRNKYEVSTFSYTSESATFERGRAVAVGGAGAGAAADAPLPSVAFSFDVSPLGLHSREERRPLYHFVTQLFAIIGGVFTVVGAVDSFVHNCASGLRRAAKSGNAKLR